MLDECFTQDPVLTVVSRTFTGRDGIRSFAEGEVFGGQYELVNLESLTEGEVVVHLRFTPQGWSRPEPDAIYRFTMAGDRIASMDLQYR